MSQLKTTQIRSPYTIHSTPPKQVPLEEHPGRFRLSNLLSLVTWSVYMNLQFAFALSCYRRSASTSWAFWIVILAEFALSFPQVILTVNLFLCSYAAKDRETRPTYRILGANVPTVDVFITCCGEAIDVIMDTLRATAAQDYPSSRYRIFVLDDAHDGELRTAVQDFAAKTEVSDRPSVQYLSRTVPPGTHSFFKAGNLQYGIEETQRLGGSEFFASLDADMIPERDWLRSMVPHFIAEDDLAIACPSPRYYNVPENDILCQQAELDMLATVFEPLNDLVDVGMCTGSGFVARRFAVNEIGGWPLLDAGEDVMCSALLINAGWKSAFVREDSQAGLACECLLAHVKQRMRWADCHIELHRQFSYYILPGSCLTSHVAWSQRAVGFLLMLRDYAPITSVLALILLPAALWSLQYNDKFSVLANTYQRSWLREVFIVSYIAQKLNDHVVWGHLGVQSIGSYRAMDIWCAPQNASRCLLSLLPFTTNSLIFTPSGTITSPANERSRHARQSLLSRLCTTDRLLYLSYAFYGFLPIALCFLSRGTGSKFAAKLKGVAPRDMDETSGSSSMFPFLGPTIALVLSTWMSMVPLRYMISPPEMPDRNDLMELDETGVRRPKGKQPRSKERVLKDNISDAVEIFGVLALYWL